MSRTEDREGIVDFLSYFAQYTLCTVFALAALPKLFNRDAFAKAIAGYRLLSTRLVRPTAFLLPWVELGCAALLGIGWLLAPVTWVAISLLAVFAVAMGINLMRGRTFQCGCGVSGTGELSWWLVGRNIVLIGLAGIVFTLPHPAPDGVSLAALMTATSMVLALSVVSDAFSTLRRIRELQRSLRLGGWAS